MTKKSQDKVAQMIAEAAETEAARFVEGFDLLKERCESPIEELLIAALYIQSKIGYIDIHFLGSSDFPKEAAFDQAVFVHQQVQIGQYRVDFLIHDASCPREIAKPRFMIVECDGHDFHERTKEQARRDKQRDRFFQAKGFKVLRFTGSEIWADPEACADEIIDQLSTNDHWQAR